MAGYSYENARTELNKFRDDDHIEMIKNGPKEKNTENETGVKIYYVDKFDPRMPHPRKLISRENIIACCERLTNLGEILSPTAQKTKPPLIPDPGMGPGGGGNDRENRSGSFYCDKYVNGGSCDVCSHMMRETACGIHIL